MKESSTWESHWKGTTYDYPIISISVHQYYSLSQALTALDLRNTEIADAGARYRADGLLVNQVRRVLRSVGSVPSPFTDTKNVGSSEQSDLGGGSKMSENGFEAQPCITWFTISVSCDQIQYFRLFETLYELTLLHNKIGSEGARYLCDGLRTNQVLSDRFRWLVCIKNVLALQTLKVLNLGSNGIGNQGAEHIAGALATNEVNRPFAPPPCVGNMCPSLTDTYPYWSSQ